MQRLYIVIMTSLEEGCLGIHADGSSPTASEFAWKLMHDEALLVGQLFNDGPLECPEPGIRQICLGLEDEDVVLLDDCPHPNWQTIHPAFDFEDLSRGETPLQVKRWLAFEAWAE